MGDNDRWDGLFETEEELAGWMEPTEIVAEMEIQRNKRRLIEGYEDANGVSHNHREVTALVAFLDWVEGEAPPTFEDMVSALVQVDDR